MSQLSPMGAGDDELEAACAWLPQVERYHDGELAPEEFDSVESHLASCLICSQWLADLGALSRMVAAAPLAVLSGAGRKRLLESRRHQDLALRRLAGWLTAAAAIIFIAALFRGPIARSGAPATPDPWLTVAAMPSDIQPDSSDVIAQWMEDELSASQ